MPISAALLPEYDHEFANIRKTLSRVPDDKWDWKPHPKSGTMGWLASHLADFGQWTVIAIEDDFVDIGAAERSDRARPRNSAEMLAAFDKNTAEGRGALAKASDEDLMKPWSLKSGENTIFTMPKIAVLRGFVMNHAIHHRGQLSVYLRLNDIPVPALYGPSADEQQF